MSRSEGWGSRLSLGHSSHQLRLLICHGVEVLILLLALAQQTRQRPVRVSPLGLVQFGATARAMIDFRFPSSEELLPHVAPRPGLEDLHHGEDRESGEGDQGEQPAQGVAPGRVLVLAIVVGWGPVIQNREHPDDQDQAWGGELPREHKEG